ncbi:putative hydrolase or acyltransferase of alpha/beta superfamily [Thermobacillus composti KWC4]|uniref:Putative hydrolase or acyltransferase of alpha/beta superfamily n=1 Tax=Thermobacillus composti (strain DSM 18247 / JCM 13945 / KWC4) TaxID=717605 RepID=L0EI08_THECK|nr:alpha/beta hydrolase [Thermobacillus composti]AGA59432.1 putative hydrolase or acyltransferase of alpha/beta superfamily [Thermobacillus composti KWC4]
MWMLLIAVLLLTGLTAALWLYNRIRSAQAEAAFPPAGSFITVEGTKLHYIRKGEGTPVVLLHGGVLRANDFDQVVERAAACGYEAIAFDRPGYGYSERPPRATPADQARLIHGALKQMGVEKPIIVGHSWSGLLALTYALHYPDDVSGVVTLAGAMYKEEYPAEHGDPISRLAAAPVVGPIFVNTVPGSPLGMALARSSVRQAFAPEPVPAGYREAALELWLRPGQFRANREDILAFVPAALEAGRRYREIRCPVVIAVGEEDPYGTREQAARLKRDIPHAELREIPRVAHMIPQLHPELALEAIDRVRELSGAAPSVPVISISSETL